MTRRRKNSGKDKGPEHQQELKGFEIGINAFGEIRSNTDIDEINKFLDEHLADRKLKNKIKKK
ncbi:MAG TPA: hypothetical protein VI583_08105 [Cyclobacteriaceae bacterium]|nr:hypothetical protein [Cyclobacteriaceae bacterium]